jgi:osmoprotectant transport system ATP-binding protein
MSRASFLRCTILSERGATLTLRGVGVTYPESSAPAVRDVDLEVAAGTFTVLLGPSGSGKSTLLRTINRLIEPTSGTILLDGTDVHTHDPVALRRGIGYAIQAVGLFPHLSVGANIAVVPELLGWDRARITARIDTLLHLVRLDPARYRDRLPRELSGGEAQRVGVARALAGEPALLLMDEPFGAVDAIVRASLQDELRAIHRELGTTIVFVTHDVDEALRLADRIVVMNAGTIVQTGAPGDVLASPANDTVRRLVGIDAESRRFAEARPLLDRAAP